MFDSTEFVKPLQELSGRTIDHITMSKYYIGFVTDQDAIVFRLFNCNMVNIHKYNKHNASIKMIHMHMQMEHLSSICTIAVNNFKFELYATNMHICSMMLLPTYEDLSDISWIKQV